MEAIISTSWFPQSCEPNYEEKLTIIYSCFIGMWFTMDTHRIFCFYLLLQVLTVSFTMAGHGERDGDQDHFTRNAAAFFERFDRYESQELLSYASSHWMLSNDDFKYPTEPPLGLISNINKVSDFSVICLLPVEDGMDCLDLREVHQIIRDLTIGIYVLNQLPMISLDANFDQSTSCQLPPAYHGTRVGNLLINVDYMMKGLWHGAYFPQDKRTKFSERWRGSFDVNALGKPETQKKLLPEFISNGEFSWDSNIYSDTTIIMSWSCWCSCLFLWHTNAWNDMNFLDTCNTTVCASYISGLRCVDEKYIVFIIYNTVLPVCHFAHYVRMKWAPCEAFYEFKYISYCI